MAWLNSDDILLPGALSCVDHFFRAYPEVDVLYGDRLIIDEDDRLIGRWVLPSHSSDAFLWDDYIPQETLFWRRSAWEKIGGRLDDNLRFAMDWDLLMRFHAAGCKFMHVPHFIGAFRVHGEQKTTCQINDLGAREMELVLQRWHGGRIPWFRRKIYVKKYIFRQVLADFRYSLKSSNRRPCQGLENI